MIELNYVKLQKHLYDLIEIKGEKASRITQKTGVWNIKKMMLGENEPTLKSWVRLHEEYPGDIPPPEYTDGGVVYKNVTASGKASAAGRDMEITNNRMAHDFTDGELYLIRTIRRKDPSGKLLDKLVAIALSHNSVE